MKQSKPKRKALDWTLIWSEFEDWHQGEENKARRRRCKECGTIPLVISPEWEEQQDAIQRIVEAHR